MLNGELITADEDVIKANGVHDEVAPKDELTPEERVLERKLRQQIDLMIMPLVILVYLMNYIDRNNYAAARLQGLERDLGLTPQQYETALSILFVGYILGQVPSNLLLNYMGRPSLYLGFFVLAWGLTSALTSQVRSYGGIVACRFILGLVEAPFFAGVLFYLSKWYTKQELGLRMSIFYAGSLLSGAFGNLIAAGILNGLASKRGMSAWQWLYVIEGSITCLIGIIILFVLPDFPDTWRVLSPELRAVANRRLALEATKMDVDEAGGISQVRGLKLALTDARVYILAVAYMAIAGAAGFQNFFPTLTSTLGYDQVISLLLVAPPYIFIVFYSMAHNLLSDYLGNRFWFLFYPVPVTIVGFIIFMTTSSFGPRYFSLFLMNFVFTINGTMYSWTASSIPRPPAKRAVTYAFINSIGNSASIWTPYTYRPQDAPHYRPALGTCIGLQILALSMFILLRIDLHRRNQLLEQLEHDDGSLTEQKRRQMWLAAGVDDSDPTPPNRSQQGFRYMF